MLCWFVISFQGLSGEYMLIASAACAFGISSNLFSVLGYILQATNLTRLYSIATFVNKIFFGCFFILQFAVGIEDFRPYVIAYVVCQSVATIYCAICLRQIWTAQMGSLFNAAKYLAVDIKSGIQIMIAYYASSLIVGYVRIAVQMQWGLEAFGLLSFSFSILTFVLSFIGQVSMVLFPSLKRLDSSGLSEKYSDLRGLTVVVLPLVYLSFLPLSHLLTWWLPSYYESMKYLILLLPICVFDSKMSLLCNTYLKVLRKERELLLVNVFAMLMNVILVTLAIKLTESLFCVALCSVVSIVARSYAAEFLVGRALSCGFSYGSMFSEVCLAAVFVSSTWIFGWISIFFVIPAILVYMYINHSSVKAVYRIATHGRGCLR